MLPGTCPLVPGVLLQSRDLELGQGLTRAPRLTVLFSGHRKHGDPGTARGLVIRDHKGSWPVSEEGPSDVHEIPS